MNATSVSANQTSIVRGILLAPDSTLPLAMNSLCAQSALFKRIASLVEDGDAVADLARLGRRTVDEARLDSREHAESDCVVSVVDCLERVVSGHRIAENLLSAIAEIGNANVAELARLGIGLAQSIFSDLGCEV